MRLRLLLVAVVVVAAVAAGAVAFLRPGGDRAGGAAGTADAGVPADYGTSIATAAATVVDNRAAADTLCELQPDALRSLTRISATESGPDNLRDGLPILEERLAELTQATEGRPALRPVLERVTKVRDGWRAALDAADAGKADAATAALARADRELTALDREMGAAHPGREKDCGG
jgi:hypothetical protein